MVTGVTARRALDTTWYKGLPKVTASVKGTWVGATCFRESRRPDGSAPVVLETVQGEHFRLAPVHDALFELVLHHQRDPLTGPTRVCSVQALLEERAKEALKRLACSEGASRDPAHAADPCVSGEPAAERKAPPRDAPPIRYAKERGAPSRFAAAEARDAEARDASPPRAAVSVPDAPEPDAEARDATPVPHETRRQRRNRERRERRYGRGRRGYT